MNGIQKIRFEGIDKDTELRFLKPTSYRHAVNCRVGSTEKGGLGGVENVQGNLLRPNPLLPTGDNICIGTLGDQKKARLIIWYWNSLGDHTIQTYDSLSATFSLIIQWSGLNFDRAYFITGAEIVEDQVYWTDGLNPQRKINLSRPYTVLEPPTDESELGVYKRPPSEKIYFGARGNDGGKLNQISGKDLQFTYRYVYDDEEKSVFATYSLVSLGDFYPNVIGNPNYLDITIPFDLELERQIKRIEVAVRSGNEGNWQIFHKVEDLDGSAEYTARYYGNENHQTVADSEAQKLFDAVPFWSQGLAMVKSRLFVTSDAEGLEAVDDIDLNFEIKTVGFNSGLGLKSNGSYTFGLVFYDKDERFCGVLGTKTLAMPPKIGSGVFFPFESDYVDITIAAGSIPEWATSYQIVRTEEEYYQVYAQYPVNAFFYSGTLPIPDSPPASINHVYFDGKQFNAYKGNPTVLFNHIYLQMPRRVPFVPDQDTFVRILTKNGSGEPMSEVIERVQDVIGDYLVVGDFGIGQDWNDPNAVDTVFLVEVFKINEAKTNIFYEVGVKRDVVNAGTPTREFADSGLVSNVAGDTTLQTNTNATLNGAASFRVIKEYPGTVIRIQYGNTNTPDDFSVVTNTNTGYSLISNAAFYAESPAKIKTIGFGNTEAFIEEGGFFAGGATPTPSNNYIPDYTKRDNDIGRANAELDENITFNRNGTVRYSDPFVQDSNINGLSSFSSGNQYPLPYERHKITKLIRVGRVLLSIHEDVTTALYVGEGFMKQNDDFILVKTDRVIGDDRILSGDGEFGTINPESVVEYEGQAFWWDMINGVVVNYTKAGLFPISNYGMNRFFQEKAKRLLSWLRFIDPAEAARFKIVGGYDPEYDEYALTFPPFDGNEGETWVYNVRTKRWMGTMSFIPQNYGKVANTLFSFGSDGNMYQHNANTLYNNFYGIQYNRSIRFVINEKPNKVKRFTNFHLNVAKMGEGETTGDFKVVKAYTPEGQETYIPSYEFIKKEHLYRSQVFRDINSANVQANSIALRNGDEMRSQVLEVEVHSDVNSDVNRMIESNVVYVESEYSM
jgi:hypothetical protein